MDAHTDGTAVRWPLLRDDICRRGDKQGGRKIRARCNQSEEDTRQPVGRDEIIDHGHPRGIKRLWLTNTESECDLL